MAYFKYIPFDRFASLRSGRIRFTQPGAFNDPFEMPAFKAKEAEDMRRAAGLSGLTMQTADIQQGLSQGRIPEAAYIPPIYYFMGLAPPRQEKVVPSVQAIDKLKAIDHEFGILSLSMTADNLLLWAHYAAEHRGLAVEIDPTGAEFNRHTLRDQDFESAGPVKYSSVRPKIPETDEILFQHFFVKSPEWAYEREYRIVRKLESALERKPARPETKAAEPKAEAGGPETNAPERLPVYLYDLPATAIRKVIFGARVVTEQRIALIRETSADPAFGHVKFGEAVLDPGRFKVALRDVTLDDLERSAKSELFQQAVPVMQLPREQA